MRFSAHLSSIFADLPLLERPSAARDQGYEAVESWWPDRGVAELVAEVSGCGLELTLLNAYCGDLAAGERGFLNRPECREEAHSAIEAAIACRPRYVNVLVGRGGGLQHVADVLRDATQTKRDAVLVLEHLNQHDAPDYLLPTPEAAAAMIERVGSQELGLLYDAYHARMAGLDPAKDIVRFGDVLAHVHYSEAPHRGPPGKDFALFIAALEDLNYSGTIGLEFLGTPQARVPDSVVIRAP